MHPSSSPQWLFDDKKCSTSIRLGAYIYGCNCRKKENCLLDNKCVTSNIIYKAQISNNTKNKHKKYLGVAESSSKERYNNHVRGFKHKKYMKCTELSKYIWNLENQGKTLLIKWRIAK